jgi:hypothetical protein
MRNLIVAAITSLLLLAACGDAQAKTLFVSLVQKGQVRETYTTLPTMHNEIVVTDAAVAPNSGSFSVDVAEGNALYMIETLSNDNGAVKGEVGRIENIVAAVRPVDSIDPMKSHTHDADNLTRFVHRVGTEKYIKGRPAAVARSLPIRREFTSPVAIEIDSAFLQQRLEELSGEEPFVIDDLSVQIEERGSAGGRKDARNYLRHQYEQLGFVVSEQTYGFNNANFIAEKKGSDPSKIVILSSHLDSVRNAGADDNGAGTITALAVAQALKDANLKYTLRILAFDEEELGLIGSKKYARHVVDQGEKDKILGVVNMEMTAYDSDNDGAYHVIDCNENTSASLSQVMVKAVEKNGIDLKRVDACTTRSDHSPFWDRGIPAIVISQNFFGNDGNPCYHRSCDKTQSLNWTYMTNLTAAIAHTVADLVEAQP